MNNWSFISSTASTVICPIPYQKTIIYSIEEVTSHSKDAWRIFRSLFVEFYDTTDTAKRSTNFDLIRVQQFA